jgi:hypothetical protein
VTVCDRTTTAALRLTLTPAAAARTPAQELLDLVEGRAALRAAMEKAEGMAIAMSVGGGSLPIRRSDDSCRAEQ